MPTGRVREFLAIVRGTLRDGRCGAEGKEDARIPSGSRAVLALMSALARRGPSLSFSLSFSLSLDARCTLFSRSNYLARVHQRFPTRTAVSSSRAFFSRLDIAACATQCTAHGMNAAGTSFLNEQKRARVLKENVDSVVERSGSIRLAKPAVHR